MNQRQGKPYSEHAHLDTGEPSYKGPGNCFITSAPHPATFFMLLPSPLPISFLISLFSLQIFDVSPLLLNP